MIENDTQMNVKNDGNGTKSDKNDPMSDNVL